MKRFLLMDLLTRLFFFWTVCRFISLHASMVTNNLPHQMEHPSNLFRGPIWERAHKAVWKWKVLVATVDSSPKATSGEPSAMFVSLFRHGHVVRLCAAYVCGRHLLLWTPREALRRPLPGFVATRKTLITASTLKPSQECRALSKSFSTITIISGRQIKRGLSFGILCEKNTIFWLLFNQPQWILSWKFGFQSIHR